jgi:hypothetical protein
MSEQDAYVTLIASLPSPEALFQARRPPLSRLKLDQRLKALSPEDARVLRLVEDAIDWRRFPLSATDREVVERGRRVMAEVASGTLRRIVRDRLELRTFVAALRRRARGEGPPAEPHWGFGRWLRHMERHWTDPGFRLESAYPWIREADRLVREGDAGALERLLLDRSYRMLQRHAGIHVFDLEAVVIYVLEWNIVDRATRYNREAAARRFDALTEAGLGAFAAIDFEEGAA